jgi:hypothetical protein
MVNKNGFLVTSGYKDRPDPGIRTYACADEKGLEDLILHLTGCTSDSFPKDSRGLPHVSGVKIVDGLHIYTGKST